MRCAALELIARDIRLNAIDIGWTHTPGERKWFSEEQQNELSKTIPWAARPTRMRSRRCGVSAF